MDNRCAHARGAVLSPLKKGETDSNGRTRSVSNNSTVQGVADAMRGRDRTALCVLLLYNRTQLMP